MLAASGEATTLLDSPRMKPSGTCSGASLEAYDRDSGSVS